MKESAPTTKETTRRDFGKGAAWVAPALTVLLLACSKPAAAQNGYHSDPA
jgi:hypothetical protein